jgi:hypothetical protein
MTHGALRSIPASGSNGCIVTAVATHLLYEEVSSLLAAEPAKDWMAQPAGWTRGRFACAKAAGFLSRLCASPLLAEEGGLRSRPAPWRRFIIRTSYRVSIGRVGGRTLHCNGVVEGRTWRAWKEVPFSTRDLSAPHATSASDGFSGNTRDLKVARLKQERLVLK